MWESRKPRNSAGSERIDEPHGDRPAHGLRRGQGIQLLAARPEMHLDGALGDGQDVGHVLLRLARGDPLQDLLLALQTNFRRMLEYDLFMCRTTVMIFSDFCRLLILV